MTPSTARDRAVEQWRISPVTSLVVGWMLPAVGELMRQLHAADLDAQEAGVPAEPGYQRIADAIEGALDAAALALWMSPTNDPDSDSDVAEPYLRLARVLDKAGLIDWSAFAGAPAEPTSDTEEPT